MIVCQTAVCRADLPNHLPLRHCCVSNLLFLFLLRLYARDASWHVAIPISRPLLERLLLPQCNPFCGGYFLLSTLNRLEIGLLSLRHLSFHRLFLFRCMESCKALWFYARETETGSVIDHCNTPSSLIIQRWLLPCALLICLPTSIVR